MIREIPKDAISLRKELPPSHTKVLGWVSDRSVAIHDFPLVVWRDGSDEWWGGLPGNYLSLRDLKWKLTHWRYIVAPEAA